MSRPIVFELASDKHNVRKITITPRGHTLTEVIIDDKTFVVKNGTAATSHQVLPANGEYENGNTPAGTMVAPLPGQVAQVMVKKGDKVKARQVVVTLMAMKMHNDILSPSAGRVAKVCVRAGQHVKTGDVLIMIDPV